MAEEVEEFECPDCGAVVTENDLVCPKCGLEFEFEYEEEDEGAVEEAGDEEEGQGVPSEERKEEAEEQEIEPEVAFEEEPTEEFMEEVEEEPIVRIGLEEGLTREDIKELKSAVELSFERTAKNEETQLSEEGESEEEVLYEDDDE